jgi:hypothetical protein
MPFVGETGGVGPGGGTGATGQPAEPTTAGMDAAAGGARPVDQAPDRAGLPTDPGLAERLAEARRRAADHLDHDAPRAPRPDRMQR